MERSDLEQFHSSLERVLASSNFLDDFYDAFISSSEEIKEFFRQTEMAHLKRKLATTLRLVTMAADNSPGTDIYFQHLGRYHHDIQVPEYLFKQWQEALIDSVRRSDALFSIRIEAAWRACLSIGIDKMLKAYHSAE